jgi:hypothetical protein
MEVEGGLASLLVGFYFLLQTGTENIEIEKNYWLPKNRGPRCIFFEEFSTSR